jgi:adenosylcobinamide-phosphate synthase
MSSFELIAAFLLDLILGDPPGLPHPVRGMGRLIVISETWLRHRAVTPGAERVAGVILAVVVTVLAYGASAGLIWISGGIHPILGSLVTIYLAYTTLSIKSLRDAALAVLDPLASGHLPQAREKLKILVGRKTEELSEAGIVRATVESVAENTSDGIVAPMFFMALGGAPAAMAYKAINTLDSMVGYKTPQYVNMGWASARLDDLANLLPSRLTGLLIVVAAALFRGTAGRSVRVMIRDANKHESPNSGFPEAAMAGALGIQLGGPVAHPDKPGPRAFIGESFHKPGPDHIRIAISLMVVASILMLCLVLLVWLWLRS